MAKTWSMFIDGKWVPSESGKTFGVINPATEALIAELPEKKKAGPPMGGGGGYEDYD